MEKTDVESISNVSAASTVSSRSGGHITSDFSLFNVKALDIYILLILMLIFVSNRTDTNLYDGACY